MSNDTYHYEPEDQNVGTYQPEDVEGEPENKNGEQEMEWELMAREAVQSCIESMVVVNPTTVEMQHSKSCSCVACTKGSGGSYDFISVDELVNELIDIAANEWTGYAPFESGVAVFEFDAVEWQDKINFLLMVREDLAEWNPWGRAFGRPEKGQKAKVLYRSRSAAARISFPNGQVRPVNQKVLIYIMHDGDHPFLVMRRTEQNTKGRYVTRDEFLKVGLCWPNPFVKTRDEMALKLGQAILDEAGV